MEGEILVQRFKRPPEPSNFAPTVAVHRENTRNFHTAHMAAKTIGKQTFEFKSAWQKFKSSFVDAQKGKCGYCESYVTVSQHGDVEHFHPKGQVWQHKVKPSTKASRSKKGPERDVLCDQGYWFLAYEWSNYLLACQICNQVWKGSFFPVRAKKRKLPPDEVCSEEPLLLNPFCEINDPADHLEFDEFGRIFPHNGSEEGFETIRTCGLDRQELLTPRRDRAIRAYSLLGDFAKSRSVKEAREILTDYWNLGDPEYSHSGMVRAIFKQQTGRSWAELEAFLGLRQKK